MTACARSTTSRPSTCAPIVYRLAGEPAPHRRAEFVQHGFGEHVGVRGDLQHRDDPTLSGTPFAGVS
jgi:hypothetical protein